MRMKINLMAPIRLIILCIAMALSFKTPFFYVFLAMALDEIKIYVKFREK